LIYRHRRQDLGLCGFPFALYSEKRSLFEGSGAPGQRESVRADL